MKQPLFSTSYAPRDGESTLDEIETNNRFESYQTEIRAISKLGISFEDWMKLAPASEVPPEGTNLMFIIPVEPLAV